MGLQLAQIKKAYIKLDLDETETGNYAIGVPGPSTLKSGDFYEGYYGLTELEEFGTFLDGYCEGQQFDGETLAKQLGITEGNSMNHTEPWFKFSYNNKTIFTPKKVIRHSISWNHLQAKGCVNGTAEIHLTSGTYKPKLFTLEAWKKLIQPLSTGGWGESFTDEDIGFVSIYENGRQQWLADKSQMYGPNGNDRFGNYATPDSSHNESDYGWRPALVFTL